MSVRPYHPDDYESLRALYVQGDLYGGQFDADRDSKARLDEMCRRDAQSVLVFEQDGVVVGTISLLENGRFAWLMRFAVMDGYDGVVQALYARAADILRARGHLQVLVYAPAGQNAILDRYKGLGLQAGLSYTCFWAAL